MQAVLTQVGTGEKAKITAIEGGRGLRQRLFLRGLIEGKVKEQVAGMGIRVGKRIKMLTKHPLKGPIVVTVDRSNTSFGLALAEHIVVEVEK
jgi:ferrous iron transport protein A